MARGPALRPADARFVARYGPTAVVTGSAQGIGAGFAQALAARGLDLVLTDIDAPGLECTAAAIRDRYDRRVDVIPLDMAEASAPTALYSAAAKHDIGLVICNHLMPGGQSRFVDAELDGVHAQIDANIRAYVDLAHVFGRHLRDQGRGGLILMSSLTGVVGAPFVSLYGASKSFIAAFGAGLAYELQSVGVSVLTLVPSSVNTETYRRAEQRRSRLFPPMEVDEFVEAGLGHLGKHWVAVPGRRNAVTAAVLGRLMPRQAAVTAMGRSMERLIGNPPPGDF